MDQSTSHHAQEARWPQHDEPDAPALRGPWRILLLHRSPDDPKWAIATIALDSDVHPAVLDAAGRYFDWDATTQ